MKHHEERLQALLDRQQVQKEARKDLRPCILISEGMNIYPDKDSGSLRLYEIIRLLVKSFRIVIWPNGIYKETDHLTGLGVQILSSDPAARSKEIGALKDEISHVLLCRPYSIEIVLPQIEERLPKARFIYDTVDLHHVRMQREGAMSDSNSKESLHKASAEVRITEFLGILECNETWVVSHEEKAYLKSHFPNKKIRVITNIHKPSKNMPNFGQTKHIYFIGGFAHGPNYQGLEWFVDRVWPSVQDAMPELRFHIFGSQGDPKIERRLKRPGIDFIGYTENVEPLLKNYRLCVAPLRFGAGVKGKIGQAMALGVPVVTTSIGAEGFGFKSQEVQVADSPEDFVATIIQMYKNLPVWKQTRKKGLEYVRDNMSPTVMRRKLKTALNSEC